MIALKSYLLTPFVQENLVAVSITHNIMKSTNAIMVLSLFCLVLCCTNAVKVT